LNKYEASRNELELSHNAGESSLLIQSLWDFDMLGEDKKGKVSE
jgi:hypothetical protein